jgi:hypothetical protein
MPARRRFRSYLCIACSKLALHCESATSASIEYILENASQVIVNKLFRISVETVGSYIQDLSENASESAVKYIALNSCGTKIIKSKIPSKSHRLVPLYCFQTSAAQSESMCCHQRRSVNVDKSCRHPYTDLYQLRKQKKYSGYICQLLSPAIIPHRVS